MNLFFDTSALAKFFSEEEGTDIVTKLNLDQNNRVRETPAFQNSTAGRLNFNF